MGIVMSSFALASAAGVPIGLFLAAHFSWHTPFFVIAAVCGVLALGAWVTLPPLAGHLQHQRGSPLASIVEVLKDTNHQKAFLFTALMMVAGFTVIPYITIYTTTNGGLTVQQVPYVYLLGGAATLVTTRWVGRLTDSVGKAKMFSIMSVFAMLSVVLVTLSAPLGLWGILMVTTIMFIGINGRMVPGMALVASTASPKLRGTFMALNSSVQSAAMGVALGARDIASEDPAEFEKQFQHICAVLAATRPTAVNLFWAIERMQTLFAQLKDDGVSLTEIRLALIEEAEIQVLGEFIEKMKVSKEGDHTLLDKTAIFYTSNLGNSSSHDNNNLPILLAGGGFKHKGHVASDTKNNTLLSNLYVRMLHHMGIEAKSFGASTGVVSEV